MNQEYSVHRQELEKLYGGGGGGDDDDDDDDDKVHSHSDIPSVTNIYPKTSIWQASSHITCTTSISLNLDCIVLVFATVKVGNGYHRGQQVLCQDGKEDYCVASIIDVFSLKIREVGGA